MSDGDDDSEWSANSADDDHQEQTTPTIAHVSALKRIYPMITNVWMWTRSFLGRKVTYNLVDLFSLLGFLHHYLDTHVLNHSPNI